MVRPVAVDLFSGAGGLSLGLEQSGFDVKCAIELDPIHAATHKFNFPNCSVIAKSVTDVTGQEILKATGHSHGEIELVCGGAPCQGFSLIGHRALDDPRNRLVSEFIRIVSELDAPYFLFENVKGLTIGKHRSFLSEIVSTFKSNGYEIVTPWQVLNAADFGVPQSRERLFLLGYKKGRTAPKYPLQITSPHASLLTDNLTPGCRDALADLPNADKYETLRSTDEVRSKAWGVPSEYAAVLRGISDESWYYGHPRVWDPEILTSSQRTEHSDISASRFRETECGKVEPVSRFYKLSEKGVSNTLRAGTDSKRGAFTSPRPIHYKYNRCITVREMARLHGFPDWFRFHRTKWHGARQVGNAVVPPVARIIGGEILKALGRRAQTVKIAHELGDDSLLSFDMSKAARYWGVKDPIGKRDKKSGKRKRSQLEVEADRALDNVS